jgi:hypothetical protein
MAFPTGGVLLQIFFGNNRRIARNRRRIACLRLKPIRKKLLSFKNFARRFHFYPVSVSAESLPIGGRRPPLQQKAFSLGYR